MRGGRCERASTDKASMAESEVMGEGRGGGGELPSCTESLGTL